MFNEPPDGRVAFSACSGKPCRRRLGITALASAIGESAYTMGPLMAAALFLSDPNQQRLRGNAVASDSDLFAC